MLTVMVILAIAAFALTIGSAIGKVPLWIAVMLLSIMALLQAAIPLGK